MTNNNYICDCCCDHYHNGYFHLCPHSNGYVNNTYDHYTTCKPGCTCKKCKPHYNYHSDGCKPHHNQYDNTNDCKPHYNPYDDHNNHTDGCKPNHNSHNNHTDGCKPNQNSHNNHTDGCKPNQNSHNNHTDGCKPGCPCSLCYQNTNYNNGHANHGTHHNNHHSYNYNYNCKLCKPNKPCYSCKKKLLACECYSCKPVKKIPCECAKCKCYGGCLVNGKHKHCIYVKAVTNIIPCDSDNIDVHGCITFEEYPCGRVRIYGKVYGLTEGKHGFTIYTSGNVKDECDNLGGHFNPCSKKHGDICAKERHVGDLGNITADIDGVAEIDFFDCVISLRGINSIIGRGLVIHENEDDLGLGGNPESLISGNAGARFAYGIISYK